MKAKYYIYWNSQKGCYAIRYRKKVIAYHKDVMACVVKFKVLDKGRQKVLETNRKHVHAFVVANTISTNMEPWIGNVANNDNSVHYNPFIDMGFVNKNNMPVNRAGLVRLSTMNGIPEIVLCK
jgi:hypothetical protein